MNRPEQQDWQMMAPDPRLRPHVLCYYAEVPPATEVHTGQRPGHAEELLIPDGHSELVFVIDSAFERWAVGHPERRAVMRQSYVIGSRSHSVITRDLGPVAVAGVKLDPRALRWLLGTSLTDFSDATLSLRELGQARLLELEDAVAGAARGAPGAVAQALDRALLRALRDMPASSRPIDDLVTQIRASRGAMPILEWVARQGLDARQVERQFAAAMGMTPKRYARVIRFKHSYHQLIGRSSTQPLGVHLDGFYDQSHFNREFRAFIGAPPRARLAHSLGHATNISDRLLAGELLDEGRAALSCVEDGGRSSPRAQLGPGVRASLQRFTRSS
jgi:AraC-like DNA-binding protein